MADISIVPVERLELTFAPRRWPFAEQRRAEIDAHFTRVRQQRPGVWNGRVLLMHEHELAGAVMRGRFFEADFASFTAWRAWGCPDPTALNCFAAAAMRSSDGAFLLGVMSEQTANAGSIYFPCGTPEPADVIGGAVDLERNIWRELAEETDLQRSEFEAEPGWRAVLAGPYLALIKCIRAREGADTLRSRIVRFLAAQSKPELSDIRIVRSTDDFDPKMPAFVRAYLSDQWAATGVA
jgi:hypothetical protein